MLDPRRAALLAFVLLALGCAGGGSGAPPGSPTITAFSAARASVTAGASTSLVAVFAGGLGTVDGGVGAITSGVPIDTGPLSASTTFTLTVEGGGGRVQRSVTVLVVAPPRITRFSAAQAAVAAGSPATLTAVFTGGAASVDHGVGAVSSGTPATTAPLTATTAFTLTVTNVAGDSATARTEIPLLPSASVITFTTEGDAFAPVITVEGSPEILWTFADGSTSTSAAPAVSFGSPGTRRQTLSVTPWAAVKRINIGYDGQDGGSAAIEAVADQRVSAVQGLEVVAPTLEQWCSSHNLLTALDFGGFTRLDTIEAYQSRSLASVNLRDTPALARACFEQCSLEALDVSTSPALADLRGAENQFSTIAFGSGSFPELWHVCTRDNPQLTDPGVFADLGRFPHLAELWIWGDHQAGALRVPSTHPTAPVSLIAHVNGYTSADLRGALQNATQDGLVDLSQNALASVDLSGCVQITQLDLHQNALPQGAVDRVLTTLDALGRSSRNATTLTVDVSGPTNAAPGSAGATAAASLRAKGWTVVTN